MPTYYPPNVQGGIGVFNLTNCKLTYATGSAYVVGLAQRTTSYAGLIVHVNYCDLPGFGSADPFSSFVSSWFRYPSTVYATVYLNSVRTNAALGYGTDLNIPTSNYSTNLFTHGTSQYPVGYTPVPTVSPSGRILRVGPTRTYTTVYQAYLAAVHGDDIIIDPGMYNCGEFYGSGTLITKCVRFWGATEDPDDVILYNVDHYYGDHWFFWHLHYFVNIPDEYKAPGMFHLTLQNVDASSWEVSVDIGMDQYNIPVEDPTEWWPPVENPFWTEYDDAHEEEKRYE